MQHLSFLIILLNYLYNLSFSSYNIFVNRFIKLGIISLFIIGLLGFFFIPHETHIEPVNNNETVVEEGIKEDGIYTSKEDVALYIHTYNKLPSNYVTKSEARKMGWVAKEGNLRKVCENCSIGGDIFTNQQKVLPTKKGRTYYECDIGYEGGTRNAYRIVYSNDGLIYYTHDHYNTFELLYGEP